MSHDAKGFRYEAMGPIDQTIDALGKCTFLPGHPHKRFAYNMHAIPVEKLSEAQIRYVLILAYRYRRQMPEHLVPKRIADRG